MPITSLPLATAVAVSVANMILSVLDERVVLTSRPPAHQADVESLLNEVSLPRPIDNFPLVTAAAVSVENMIRSTVEDPPGEPPLTHVSVEFPDDARKYLADDKGPFATAVAVSDENIIRSVEDTVEAETTPPENHASVTLPEPAELYLVAESGPFAIALELSDENMILSIVLCSAPGLVLPPACQPSVDVPDAANPYLAEDNLPPVLTAVAVSVENIIRSIFDTVAVGNGWYPPPKYPDVLDAPGLGPGEGDGPGEYAVFDDMSRR